jgi:hypothetical protein
MIYVLRALLGISVVNVVVWGVVMLVAEWSFGQLMGHFRSPGLAFLEIFCSSGIFGVWITLLEDRDRDKARRVAREVDRLAQGDVILVADEKEGYELLLVRVGSTMYPYLKMRNPSTGQWHVEGVGDDCRGCERRRRNGVCEFVKQGGRGCITVEAALYYRNGFVGNPDVLT